MGALASVVMSSLAWWFPGSVAALMLPVMLYTAALGVTLPHAMSLALQPWPHVAGTASSLLGFIQMTVAAGAGALVGLFLEDTPAPMLVMMCLLSLAGLLLAWRSMPPGPHPREEP